jgi:hypothetical protein
MLIDIRPGSRYFKYGGERHAECMVYVLDRRVVLHAGSVAITAVAL